MVKPLVKCEDNTFLEIQGLKTNLKDLFSLELWHRIYSPKVGI